MLKMTIEQIIEYFEQNRQEELRDKINKLHPADSAQIINELPSEYQLTAFSLLNTENASPFKEPFTESLKEPWIATESFASSIKTPTLSW